MDIVFFVRKKYIIPSNGPTLFVFLQSKVTLPKTEARKHLFVYVNLTLLQTRNFTKMSASYYIYVSIHV